MTHSFSLVSLCLPFVFFFCASLLLLQVFWPIQAWQSSKLIVVLDAESRADHAAGTILQNMNLVSKVRVKYEAGPPEGILCANWRGEGYARQQYSNFYADLYTDADYVAIVDTDAIFMGPGEQRNHDIYSLFSELKEYHHRRRRVSSIVFTLVPNIFCSLPK